ncbi:FGGY family carbohydrate kinase, partial [Megasphaera sp.]
MKYVMGIDIGTSATKTVLFDETCQAVAMASCEYPLYQPQNGWAEQQPEDWYQAVVQTIREILAKSPVDAKDIVGIGLSGQMHG